THGDALRAAAHGQPVVGERAPARRGHLGNAVAPVVAHLRYPKVAVGPANDVGDVGSRRGRRYFADDASRADLANARGARLLVRRKPHGSVGPRGDGRGKFGARRGAGKTELHDGSAGLVYAPDLPPVALGKPDI